MKTLTEDPRTGRASEMLSSLKRSQGLGVGSKAAKKNQDLKDGCGHHEVLNGPGRG
jgi:hypothetical protein